VVADTKLQLIIFIGPTEQEILNNIEDIVKQALPLDKLKKGYADLNTSKNLILNRVTFCQSRVDVSMQPRLLTTKTYKIKPKDKQDSNVLKSTLSSLV